MCLCACCTWELEWAGGSRAGRRVGVGAAAGWGGGVRRVWGDGEGAPAAAASAVRLLEGLWEGGVEGHVWLIVGEVAELDEQAVLGVELTVTWHQDRREHWIEGENKVGEGANKMQ